MRMRISCRRKVTKSTPILAVHYWIRSVASLWLVDFVHRQSRHFVRTYIHMLPTITISYRPLDTCMVSRPQAAAHSCFRSRAEVSTDPDFKEGLLLFAFQAALTAAGPDTNSCGQPSLPHYSIHSFTHSFVFPSSSTFIDYRLPM